MDTRPTPDALLGVVRAWAQNPRRAVIFDFNGTLSNDEQILLEIYTGLFRDRFGWQLTPEYYDQYLLGRSDREIVEITVAEHGAADPATAGELLALRRQAYRREVAHRSPIGEGAIALLRRLAEAEIPRAVVTGAERDDVRAVLDGCEAGDLIRLLVAEEDIVRGKPDPEGFLKGAMLLDRDPSEILVFEDSLPGVAAAVRAGMTCVAVAGLGAEPLLAAGAGAWVPGLSPRLLDAAG